MMNKIDPIKKWLEYARILPIDEVIRNYISEIEEITGCYIATTDLNRILKEIIEIYKPSALKKLKCNTHIEKI